MSNLINITPFKGLMDGSEDAAESLDDIAMAAEPFTRGLTSSSALLTNQICLLGKTENSQKHT